MIPNIFISSTISDLHYLRDALREAVAELAYNPIMSEYGDVGYINPTSAAESCYRTVRQCQLATFIVGRRYGDIDEDGLSVTHREFLTAREHRIPTIAFIEQQVLHYKEVYDSNPTAPTWNNFSGMDHPHKTFAFVSEIRTSEFYNGLLPITTAAEAKRLLKVQIADFVGEKLNDVVRPVKSEVQEILAELKTLRKEIAPKSQLNSSATGKYLQTLRFLLKDQQANFRKFCEVVAFDLDAAVPLLIKHADFDAFVAALNTKLVIEDDHKKFDQMMRPALGQPPRLRFAHSGDGWWAFFDDGKVVLSTSQLMKFRATYSSLQENLSVVT